MYRIVANNEVYSFKHIWSLAATGFHFLLDKKTKQKNQAAKKALLRMLLPHPQFSGMALLFFN